MAILSKPLTDRLGRPLGAAVLWGLLASAVTAVIAFTVGGAGMLVRWALEGFEQLSWPWDLVRGVAAVGAPLSVVSSTWAASYASTQAAPAGRALLASAAGVLVLIGGVALDWLVSLFAAAVAAWSLAIPFEAWNRFLARLAVAAAAVAASPLLFATTSWWAIAIAATVSYPSAALSIGIGDWTWRRAQAFRDREP